MFMLLNMLMVNFVNLVMYTLVEFNRKKGRGCAVNYLNLHGNMPSFCSVI